MIKDRVSNNFLRLDNDIKLDRKTTLFSPNSELKHSKSTNNTTKKEFKLPSI